MRVIRLYDGDDVDLVRGAALRAGERLVRPGFTRQQIAPQLLPGLALDSGWQCR